MNNYNPKFSVELIAAQVTVYLEARAALENHRKRYGSIHGPVGKQIEAEMTSAFVSLIAWVGDKFAVLLDEIEEYKKLVEEVAESRWDE